MPRYSVATLARTAALLAAMFISYDTQRHLALTHGVPEWSSYAVPVAIDLFMIWAVRTRRDVLLSVAIAVAANVAGVLTTESLAAVDTWVSAGLHAVFPLSVWRMHRKVDMSAEAATPTATSADTAPATSDDSWFHEDLWSDFKGGNADSADSDAATTGQREGSTPTLDEIRAAMAVLSADGRTVTGRRMADHFHVAERTGRRYLALIS